MRPDNLPFVRLCAAWAAAMSPMLACADPDKPVGPDPQPPELTAADQRYLARVARRTLATAPPDAATTDHPPYVPSALANVQCQMIVTLRADGEQLAIGMSERADAVRATAAAARAAMHDFQAGADEPPLLPPDLLIELEALGNPQPLHFAESLIQPGVIERALEPGLDGFAVHGMADLQVSPSQLVLKNLPPSEALKRMLITLGRVPESLTISRFRSVHWYQPAPDADIVTLRRGMVPLPGDAVTPAKIDGAIDRLAVYLAARQQPDGSFADEYEPVTNAYTRRSSIVDQAGAAWALADVARQQNDDAHNARRALNVHAQRLREMAALNGAACITSPDQSNPLALTAQVHLALHALGDDERTADRRKLAAGMLWLMRDSGEFVTAFPPARRLPDDLSHAGVALLSLATHYADRPDAAVLSAFHRALRFYRNAFESKPATASAAWLAQGFARMAAHTGRRDFAQFAFQLCDWLVYRQRTFNHGGQPVLHGGVAPDHGRVPDAQTALCLSAWCDAIVAAQRFDDNERVVQYELAARRAARFVLQLQVRPSETYWMRVPTEAVGGVRTSPADQRLPIVNVQYALQGLLDYRRVVLALPG